MAPQALNSFTYRGMPLEQPPEKLEDCNTDAKVAAYWIDKLRQSNIPEVRFICLHYKAIQRLPKPKVLPTKTWEQQEAVIELNETKKQAALAYHMLLPATNERDELIITQVDSEDIAADLEPCKVCAHSKATGPFSECVASHGKWKFMNGSCTCCYYKGRSNCSHRATYKTMQAETLKSKKVKFTRFTQKTLEKLDLSTISEFRSYIRLAKEKRQSKALSQGSPSKKPRIV